MTVVQETAERITRLGLESSSACLLPEGSVLFSSRATIGKIGIAGVQLATNQGFVNFIPRPGLTSRYLAYALLYFTPRIEELAGKTTFKEVPRGALKRFRIPIPDEPEQDRIVDILDRADALRRKRAEADRLAARILPALFHDMFGDPVTNPMGWPMVPLGELGDLDRGRSRHRPRNDPALLGGPYPFIQTGDVANADGVIRSYSATYSELGLAQSRLWPAGTLCITIAANIADTAVLGFDACFPDSVVGFTAGGDTCAQYIRIALGFFQSVLQDQAPQAAQKNINLKVLRELPIPVPPVADQLRFARLHDRVLELDQKRDALRGRMDKVWDACLFRAFGSVCSE